MPYDEPDAEDPNVLVGVGLPAGPEAALEMVAALAEEFAQLGFSRQQILGLFRNRFYAGAHAAGALIGVAELGRIVDEAVAVYSAQRLTVRDGGDAAGPPPRRRSLRVLG